MQDGIVGAIAELRKRVVPKIIRIWIWIALWETVSITRHSLDNFQRDRLYKLGDVLDSNQLSVFPSAVANIYYVYFLEPSCHAI